MTADPAQVLACPMQDNDADAETIREYLIALLSELWILKEAFGGKRPFGNSGWDGELAVALVRAGLVTGVVDEDGDLDSADWDSVESSIAHAINHLAVVAE